MRRKGQEITHISMLEAILQKGQICRLGINSLDAPYVVPVNYGYEAGKLYIHSVAEGKKIDLLRQDPRLAFEVEIETRLNIKGETPCNWGMQYQSIIGTGFARFLEEDAEKRHGLDVIVRHYGGEPPDYSPSTLDRIVVIEIKINEMTGKNSDPLPANLAHSAVEGKDALG